MTKAETKNLLKARVVPHLISKGKSRPEAENYFEAMWRDDPNPVSIETKLAMHKQPTT